jgi:hypothetical protein
MSPILTPSETIEAYEAARASVQAYEVARASARSKLMNVRVVEGIVWTSMASVVAFALAIAAQALGVYPI